jgi:hypothetical protein
MRTYTCTCNNHKLGNDGGEGMDLSCGSRTGFYPVTLEWVACDDIVLYKPNDDKNTTHD